MTTKLIALPLALSLGACQVRQVDTVDRTLPANEIQRLLINTEQGYLDIEGVPGLQDIDVHISLVAPEFTTKREARDDLQFRLEDRGNGDAILRVESEDLTHADVYLAVPEWLDVDIIDGSGAIDVRGVNSVIIDDGSGEITVRDIETDVEIKDGSGDLTVRNVRGKVVIDDGSGDISVHNVGDLRLGDTGSGDVQVF